MDTNTKKCPYCAEVISKEAKKCKHCGELLDQQLRDIETLKQSKQVIVSNNNNNNNDGGRRPYPWLAHFILTLLTGGIWLPFWVLFYLFRNRKIYF